MKKNDFILKKFLMNICFYNLKKIVIEVNNRQGDWYLVLTKAICNHCPQEISTSKALICQPIVPAKTF